MAVTILIWCYITIVTLTVGWGAVKIIEKATGREWSSVSVVWMLGLCLVTVYAEVFSLFYKVGAIANYILVAIVILILCMNRKKIAKKIKMQKLFLSGSDRWKTVRILINCVIIILFICISCLRAIHADTDLYHAQAIRWIEEYGVVKGLGNLHNRLAYNSSFMCLQALFSGKFVLDQSTHVVNGYIGCGMLLYALNTLIFRKKVFDISCSNLFRVVTIIYICNPYSMSVLSSPNTDNFSLLLVLFILIKWAELLEKNCKVTEYYAILCILGVFAISLKLSTAMVVLLAVKPAAELIRERRVRETVFFIFMGILVLTPFLVRNVIISGYLVYPYSVIDVFNVDWKMAGSVVDFDRKEIMAYGRGLNDYVFSDYTLSQWFPIWWAQQSLWLKGMVIINILLEIVYIFSGVMKQRKLRSWDEWLIFAVATISFAFWLVSAPLVRYGMIFVFEVPCVVLGGIRKDISMPHLLYYVMGVCLTGFVMISAAGRVIAKKDEISFMRSAYYIYRECEKLEWEDGYIYKGSENNYCGYYCFPSTPYRKILNYIELRDKQNIKEGFRVREDAKEIRFNNSGMIY